MSNFISFKIQCSKFNIRYSFYKRIILHLITNRCLRAVARVYNRCGRQRKKPGLDAFHQLFEIARREIGAAYGFFEQHVASDHKAIRRTVKT